MRTGLTVICAIVAVSFFDVWWLSVIGVTGCVLLVGWLEHENDQLRALLGLHTEAQRLGLSQLSSPGERVDALDRRRPE